MQHHSFNICSRLDSSYYRLWCPVCNSSDDLKYCPTWTFLVHSSTWTSHLCKWGWRTNYSDIKKGLMWGKKMLQWNEVNITKDKYRSNSYIWLLSSSLGQSLGQRTIFTSSPRILSPRNSFTIITCSFCLGVPSVPELRKHLWSHLGMKKGTCVPF